MNPDGFTSGHRHRSAEEDKMKTTRLPILRGHANCPKCGLPTDDFSMFESGLGGDFETFVGAQSGRIYRLDLGKVHYQGQSRSDLMADAIKKEGRLFAVPRDIQCKICGTALGSPPVSVAIVGEETVDAWEL